MHAVVQALTWHEVLIERDRTNVQNFLCTSTVNTLKVRILRISEWAAREKEIKCEDKRED